jgi:hypothetical protein
VVAGVEAGGGGGAALGAEPDEDDAPRFEVDVEAVARGVAALAVTYFLSITTTGGGVVAGVNRRTTKPSRGGVGIDPELFVVEGLSTGSTGVSVEASAAADLTARVAVPHVTAASVHEPIRANRERGIRLMGARRSGWSG